MYFLEAIAEELWSQLGQEMTHRTIVFPGKRSIIYFTGYLRDRIDEDFIFPRLITISELIEQYGRFVIADRLSLCVRLYDIFVKHTGTKESFSEFFNFGNTLLSDFDAIDKNLVRAKELFQNVEALKKFDLDLSYLSEEQVDSIKRFWGSFNTKKLSEQQDAFVILWEKLYPIYRDFNDSLARDGIAYEGKVFRDLAENPSPEMLGGEYFFVGFNALGKAEEKIFSYLKTKERASFYWDYDEYFTQNNENEAGYFMRRLLPKFPPFSKNVSVDNRDNRTKKINHISCSGEVQQAKILGKILAEDLAKGVDLSDVAIVLANEDLLLPVLESIPPDLEKLNVSIGYPPRATAWAHLFSAFVVLQKTKIKKNDEFYFPISEVLEILNNPYCRKINENGAVELRDFILKRNLGIIAQKDLLVKFPHLFVVAESVDDFVAKLKCILDILYPLVKDKPIEQYVLSQTVQKTNQLVDFLDKKVEEDLYFFCELLQKSIKEIHIPFANQSKGGVQIIGFLETRLLDFKRVFVLSVNEDYLPNVQQSGAFIPYNLRVGYGLPTFTEQSAMYAYYFYRLLGRAGEVTLFSVQGSQVTKMKEPSRYITQLQYESPFQLESFTGSALLSPIKPREECRIDKGKLKAVYERYFRGEKKVSPSAVNMFVRCPQSFYYRYVEGIRPVESVSRSDDYDMFGSIFHKAVELLYQPYIGQELRKDSFDHIVSRIPVSLNDAFSEELYGGVSKVLDGKDLLIFDILAKYINRLVDYDKYNAPFTILELEKKCEATMQIDSDGEKRELTLHGFIDRVDRKDGQVRLIDYKTGHVELRFESIELLFDSEEKKPGIAQQMLFYSWLYFQEHKQVAIPHVFSTKELQDKDTQTNLSFIQNRKVIPLNMDESLIEDYEIELRKVLSYMFSPVHVAFPPNDKHCEHDSYTGVCTIFNNE